ncbi:MAG: hypothetical protein IJP86_10110 [Synergistaceae bacterium]|nr:hypothetical protein [Synergistaceae bacterium]
MPIPTAKNEVNLLQTTKEAVYAVLSSEDFSNWSVSKTLQSISDNPGKFYLLSPDSHYRLYEAIAMLSDKCADSAELTQVRFAHEIVFPLRVYLQTGDNEEGGLEVKTFSELLGFLKYDESMRLARNDFHVVVDDTGRSEDDEEARKPVADIFQQTIYLSTEIRDKEVSQ